MDSNEIIISQSPSAFRKNEILKDPVYSDEDGISIVDDKNDISGNGKLSRSFRSGQQLDKMGDKERKLGHRRVGVGGEITYKKIQTTQIMGSIQLGIQQAVGGLASKPDRDLLMQDFTIVETINFPREGSNLTPAHHYSEFKFKNYAPIAFRYFRDLFGIQPDDFLMSMCSSSLRELSNPGASGSIFYLTEDDEFIIKTVQHKEGEFLQKLLAGYYMNLNQNPRTLLPKFFGLYCYQCNSKNVRLVVMNNLLPSTIKLHLKYDLKGSTYKRKASKTERSKKSPTYKDLDFMEHHPEGIFLEADTYTALIKTIQRDCRVLESFKIMDYSLLLAVHNLDLMQKEKLDKLNAENEQSGDGGTEVTDANKSTLTMLNAERAAEKNDRVAATKLLEKVRDRERDDRITAMAQIFQQRDKSRFDCIEKDSSSAASTALNRSRSINRQRLVAHSTAMESIQAESEPIDEEEDVPPGGIPARSAKGERLLLFIGIIDILQSYRFKKKLEHTFKSMIHDGDTVSVHRPGFYAQRFQDFMADKVFKKIPSLDLPEIKGNHRKFRTFVTSYIALKHSPSKRKSLSRPLRQESEGENNGQTAPCSSTSAFHVAAKNSSFCNSNAKPSIKLESPTQVLSPSVPNKLSSAITNETTTTCSSHVTSASVTYPSVLNDDALAITGGETGTKSKARVPPPVPPRGSPRPKKSDSKGLSQSLNCSTPPPPFEDVYRHGSGSYENSRPVREASSSQTAGTTDSVASGSSLRSSGSMSGRSDSSIGRHSGRQRVGSAHQVGTFPKTNYRDDTVSISDIRLESRCENKSSLSVESNSSGRGGPRGAWTPPHSVEGSTPTWTEGTPSFTESSSSGDIGCPTTPIRTGMFSTRTGLAHSALNYRDSPQMRKNGDDVEQITMCLASEVISTFGSYGDWSDS